MYEYNAKVLRVVDGDTIDVMIDLGMSVHVKERLRLLGVNSPETFGVKKDSEEYKKGLKVKQWLVAQFKPEWGSSNCYACASMDGLFPLTGLPEVRIVTTKDKKGKYGRYLATVYIGESKESVNLKLVDLGYGAEY